MSEYFKEYDSLDFSSCPNCGDAKWSIVQLARHDVSYWIDLKVSPTGDLESSERTEYEIDVDGMHFGQFQCLSCHQFLPYQFERYLKGATEDGDS